MSDLYLLILVIATVLPVAYIWMRPFLSKRGFAASGCGNTPECEDGYSVSAYISNNRATGFMAFAFAFPIASMLLETLTVNQTRFNPLAFGVFSIFFGLFLSFPVTYNENVHSLVVAIFCLSAIVYLWTIQVPQMTQVQNTMRFTSIFVASAAFVGVAALALLPRFVKGFTWRKKAKPLFWAIECVGLTSVVISLPIMIFLSRKYPNL